MATAKECHTLTSYFAARYKEKYARAPVLNRYSARWGFDSVLMDMSSKEVEELIDYYFTVPSERHHNLEWFFYNYDKLAKARTDAKEDSEHRARLREESAARAETWRQSGKRGIAGT